MHITASGCVKVLPDESLGFLLLIFAFMMYLLHFYCRTGAEHIIFVINNTLIILTKKLVSCFMH